MNSKWQEGQRAFEDQMVQEARADNIQVYLDEIESVREIYTEVFHISGKVLDIGGHQGRLRYYLDKGVTEYFSIDPIPFNFHEIEAQPNLCKAYPCLVKPLPYPCKFVTGTAENLSMFHHDTFDWVHLRSVIDHLEDPEEALREAIRVCKPGGHLLVGFAVMEKLPITVRSIVRNLIKPDKHVTRLTVQELHEMYRRIGWKVEHEHWQKKPFDYCLYSCTVKR